MRSSRNPPAVTSPHLETQTNITRLNQDFRQACDTLEQSVPRALQFTGDQCRKVLAGEGMSICISDDKMASRITSMSEPERDLKEQSWVTHAARGQIQIKVELWKNIIKYIFLLYLPYVLGGSRPALPIKRIKTPKYLQKSNIKSISRSYVKRQLMVSNMHFLV